MSIPETIVAISPVENSIYLRDAGLPMRSMRGWDEGGYFVTPRHAWFGHKLPRLLQRIVMFDAIIPLKPLPIGFTVNTLFYGSIFFVVCRGARIIKQHLRRGLCPHCAYELAGLSQCPECGKTASGAMDDFS